MSLSADFCYGRGELALDIALTIGDEPMAIYGGSALERRTLLQCLTGIRRPSRGIIRANGCIWYDSVCHTILPRRKREVQYLDPTQILHGKRKWSIERHFATCNPSNTRWALEVMERMQLTPIAALHPDELSPAQQFRFSAALALAREPDLLCLDERDLAIDDSLRWQQELVVLDVLQLYSGSFLLLAATRGAVYRLCRKISVLQSGILSRSYDVHAVFEQPQTVATCRIAGYQNLTPILRLDETHVLATAWNTVLRLSSVPEDAYYLGIRTQKARLVNMPGENVISCCITRRIEQPNTVTVVVHPEGSNAQMILEFPKEQVGETERILLSLPEEALLPLC